MFKELYSYRELIKTSVKKEIRGRYEASVLGVLWSFLNPLLQVLIYAIIFPLIMKTGDNYVVYLVTGIIPWTFFSSTIASCVGSVKNNSGIIKKVYFPRIILPLSVTISGFINFIISSVIIIAFCLIFNVGISWHIILVPIVALIQTIFTFGLGLIVSAVEVYIQDLEYIINFFISLLMYASPIIYQIDLINNTMITTIISYNPITVFVTAYRDAFLYHQLPNLGMMGYVLAISLVLLLVGYIVFEKLEAGFAEQI